MTDRPARTLVGDLGNLLDTLYAQANLNRRREHSLSLKNLHEPAARRGERARALEETAATLAHVLAYHRAQEESQ